MARYSRRAIGRARSTRRTNWVASASPGVTTTVAANAETHISLLNVASTTFAEPNAYMDATLTRIRGQILCDPVMAAASSGSEYLRAWFAIYVSPTQRTFIGSTVAEAGANWSSDRIIWTGAQGYSKNTGVVSGTDAEGHLVYALRHDALNVDVKAQRKLGDDEQVWLACINSADSNISMDVNHMIRMLLKE